MTGLSSGAVQEGGCCLYEHRAKVPLPMKDSSQGIEWSGPAPKGIAWYQPSIELSFRFRMLAGHLL